MTEKCKHLDGEGVNYGYYVGEDGINIDSCCGGGCYSMTDIKYCPFCGDRLDLSVKKSVRK